MNKQNQELFETLLVTVRTLANHPLTPFYAGGIYQNSNTSPQSYYVDGRFFEKLRDVSKQWDALNTGKTLEEILTNEK